MYFDENQLIEMFYKLNPSLRDFDQTFVGLWYEDDFTNILGVEISNENGYNEKITVTELLFQYVTKDW